MWTIYKGPERAPSTLRKLTDILKESNKLYLSKDYKHLVYNLPISFDTETTNYVDSDGNKVGWMYIWMFRFGNPSGKNSFFVFGRSSEDLRDFLDKLSYELNLSTVDGGKMIYVYVHNLGFDLEFIRDLLNITDELHADKHEPIYVRDARGIEFRDSMILSGGLSLEQIGKSLRSGYTKKVGDLDYSLIRTPLTPLTDEEMGYCRGDVDVLAAYIAEQTEQYHGKIAEIPLTNTGRVRKYAYKSIFKGSSLGSISRYYKLMEKCVLSPDEYDQCQRAFFGGFSHANANYVGKTIENVESYDFTSSYPAVMLTEKFPIGTPEHIDQVSFDEYKELVNDPTKCVIADIQLSDVYLKDDVGDCYLSGDRSKVIVENPVLDNGRIRYCDRIALTSTDVDFKIINQCYDFSKISIKNLLVWGADFMPNPIIGLIVDLYGAKTTLKGVEGMEKEYGIKKAMLNSLYGMCVTRILRDTVKVSTGEWVDTPLTEEEKVKNIEKNNNSKRRFLYYPWGVYITAYARRNLWTAIKTLGDDYLYSDTDSIKVKKSSQKLTQYLEDYHHDLKIKLGWMLEYRHIWEMSDFAPKTKDGVEKPIGVWDFEGSYARFKTLGAKRYLVESHGSIKVTVAGIPKKRLEDYLMSIDGTVDTAFRSFDDGLHVPVEKAGKLASCYYSDVDLDVVDYLGTSCHVTQKYGCHLFNVDWTLTMSSSFLDLVKRLQGVL